MVDGVTNTLLSKFVVCRHRFWLKTVVGLDQPLEFEAALEFGQLWHAAEEAHSAGKDWLGAMTGYYHHLRAKYQTAEAEVRKWYAVAKLTFPIYLEYWSKHPIEKRTPILEEETFRVPYVLPSGRVVLLKGKYDNIFATKELNSYKITHGEHKTKGRIDEEGITATVDRNLQTMIYQTALRQSFNYVPDTKCIYLDIDPLNDNSAARVIKVPRGTTPHVDGVLYNVIRRPLADQHAIKQRKGRLVKGKRIGAETEKQFYDRLAATIREESFHGKQAKEESHYFYRWYVKLSDKDMQSFHDSVLNPLLEQLCDWWEWIEQDPFNPIRPGNKHHWQSPWGVYNSLSSGFRGDYFDYLTRGSTVGLHRIDTLFPELENC